MVGRMQDSSPEDPDPLAFYIEERAWFHPPRIGLRREEAEPGARQCHQPEGERFRSLFNRENARRIGLRAAKKLPEKTALRQKLMAKYVEHRAGFGVWTKRKIARLELPKHRCCFIGFARVSLKCMLQQRVQRPRNFGFANHTS